MLLWGLAGFVNPVKQVLILIIYVHRHFYINQDLFVSPFKQGKVFEQGLGLQVEDEFFKDNAIEVKRHFESQSLIIILNRVQN